jgi:cytosine/adenosine deaminase-related metal-dependent hydrolase
MLAGGHRLAAVLFGLPFGKLDAGGPADLVVLDYAPATPLRTDTLAAHLVSGISRAHVKDVFVAGRRVVRDRQVVGVAAAAIRARAVGAAERLWERMRS